MKIFIRVIKRSWLVLLLFLLGHWYFDSKTLKLLNEKQREESALSEEEDDITYNIFLIVCVAKDNPRLGEEDWRQVEQVEVLLKTLYLLSGAELDIYIINNDSNIYLKILQTVQRLHSVSVHYPEGLDFMLDMFRVCATARLFLDQMLPQLDSGIFLDTDIILMDDIRSLWNHFKHFGGSQVAGMAAVENVYGVVNHVPSYGPPGMGLNTGVIMMNLTRMRLMSGAGLTGAVKWVVRKYKEVLYFADQDILNAVFGLSPWYLYELPCQWNYVVWQCREETWLGADNPRTEYARNNCPGAAKYGVSGLHGNSLTFYHQDQLREDLFRHVFDYWIGFDMTNTQSELKESVGRLRTIISEVVQNTSHLLPANDSSPCSRVPGIEVLLTKRLEYNIQKTEK